MTANYSNNPSGFMRLIASSQDNIGTSAEDLATFFDMTPYEAILVSVVLTGSVAATSVTVKFVSSTASAGTSPVTAKDASGADIIATIANTPANGDAILLWVRTRGLLKFGSPQIVAQAATDVCVSIIGVAPRDTLELAAGWTATTTATNTAFNAGVKTGETAFS